MSVFEDVTITWKDKSFTIKSNRVMGAISRIEDILTLAQLARMQAGIDPVNMSKLAKAYHTALTYAGAEDLELDEVYSSLFSNDAKNHNAMNCLTAIMLLMVPPASVRSSTANPQEAKSSS